MLGELILRLPAINDEQRRSRCPLPDSMLSSGHARAQPCECNSSASAQDYLMSCSADRASEQQTSHAGPLLGGVPSTMPPAATKRVAVPTLAPLTDDSDDHVVHGVVSTIGGCRAYAPRASYLTALSCTEETVCEECGLMCSHLERFPSGMSFPRHNVLQYMGNDVWDSTADSLGEMVAAMLGDPFAFTVAPEVDALRRLLRDPSLSALALSSQVARVWMGNPNRATNNATRGSFIDALAGRAGSPGLTSAFVLNSSAWGRLGPRSVRRRLEGVLRGEAPPLSAEEATCAAVHIMDSSFERRDAHAIHDDLIGRFGAPQSLSTPTLFEELYNRTTADSGGCGETDTACNVITRDPHNIVFTSPHQQTVNSFYGGNLTLVFSSADAGSGLDVQWAVRRGCPGSEPARLGMPCSELSRRLNDPAARRDPRDERRMVDNGELRTPNYKEPRELLGFHLFDWPAAPLDAPAQPATPQGAPAQPLARRRVQWSIYRHTLSAAGATSELEPPMAYILAPGVLNGSVGIAGVAHDSASGAFLATQPPGAPPRAYLSDVNFEAYDMTGAPNADAPRVPVWGVLFPCTRTNLPKAYRLPPPLTAPRDAAVCAAARVLRLRRGDAPGAAVHEVLSELTLPDEWALQLAGVRVWSPDAIVDMGAAEGDAAAATQPRGARSDVCVLTHAVAERLEACFTEPSLNAGRNDTSLGRSSQEISPTTDGRPVAAAQAGIPMAGSIPLTPPYSTLEVFGALASVAVFSLCVLVGYLLLARSRDALQCVQEAIVFVLAATKRAEARQPVAPPPAIGLPTSFTSLWALVESAGEHFGDRPFVATFSSAESTVAQSLSFGQLVVRVRRARRALVRLGVPEDARVAFLCQAAHDEFVALLLAVTSFGAATMLNWRQPDQVRSTEPT